MSLFLADERLTNWRINRGRPCVGPLLICLHDLMGHGGAVILNEISPCPNSILIRIQDFHGSFTIGGCLKMANRSLTPSILR